MQTFNDRNTFTYNHIKTVRDGERKHRLRPGQVSLHNGDARTEIYDLSNRGRGVVSVWKEWAAVVFQTIDEQFYIAIEGDYPNFYVDKVDRKDYGGW